MSRKRRTRKMGTEQENEDLQQYLRDIASIPPTTEEEEHQLALRIAVGNQEARNRLVEAHLPLALKIAREHRGSGVELADLIQMASLGLIDAAQHFDPAEGRFAAYAPWWVRRHLIRALSNKPQETSLEQEEAYRKDMIQDKEMTPEEIYHLRALNSHLAATFSCLTEQERLVLMLRYGLDGQETDRTRNQVANRLHLTVDRVRRIEERAIQKIRQSGVGTALKDYWSEQCAS